MSTEDRLYNDPEIAQFYDLDNGWSAGAEYCRVLAATRSSVLDLGCGTGRFASNIAGGSPRYVVGVDPALPMLDIARARTGGGQARWIEGDARDIRLGDRFDLIVLLGHAFQVFLTEEDRRAVLRTIEFHLAPDGLFAFDSRNPNVEEWREWPPDRSRRSFMHPALGEVFSWNDASHDATTGIVTYETFYAAGERFYSCSSRIAFPSQEELASALEDAGLVIEHWLGDWSNAPYTPTAQEVIPIGRLR